MRLKIQIPGLELSVTHMEQGWGVQWNAMETTVVFPACSAHCRCFRWFLSLRVLTKQSCKYRFAREHDGKLRRRNCWIRMRWIGMHAVIWLKNVIYSGLQTHDQLKALPMHTYASSYINEGFCVKSLGAGLSHLLMVRFAMYLTHIVCSRSPKWNVNWLNQAHVVGSRCTYLQTRNRGALRVMQCLVENGVGIAEGLRRPQGKWSRFDGCRGEEMVGAWHHQVVGDASCPCRLHSTPHIHTQTGMGDGLYWKGHCRMRINSKMFL